MATSCLPMLVREKPSQPVESLSNRVAFLFFWCLVFTIPWENMVVIPGLGTVSHLVGYVAIGMGLLAVLDRGWLRHHSGVFLLMAAFSFWRCMSALWTASLELTLIEMQTSLQMLAMVWLLQQLVASRERTLAVLQAYVFGTIVSALATFQQYLSGAAAVGQSRFTATGFDPNELALMLVLGLPLSLYLAASARSFRLVCLYRLQFALVAGAVFLTAARGPFLSLAGLLFFLPSVVRRSGERQKLALLFAAVTAGILIATLIPPACWERLSTIGGEITSGSLNDRRVIWEAGLEELERHPIIGVGAGSFRDVVHNSTGIAYVAHNTFLSILVEQGLIGFSLFAALYVYCFWLCFRMPYFEKWLWTAMLVTLAIGIFSLTWEYRKPVWLIFGLISVHVGTAYQNDGRKTRQSLSALRFTGAPPNLNSVETSA